MVLSCSWLVSLKACIDCMYVGLCVIFVYLDSTFGAKGIVSRCWIPGDYISYEHQIEASIDEPRETVGTPFCKRSPCLRRSALGGLLLIQHFYHGMIKQSSPIKRYHTYDHNLPELHLLRHSLSVDVTHDRRGVPITRRRSELMDQVLERGIKMSEIRSTLRTNDLLPCIGNLTDTHFVS